MVENTKTRSFSKPVKRLLWLEEAVCRLERQRDGYQARDGGYDDSNCGLVAGLLLKR
jgi:hypothetical protein